MAQETYTDSGAIRGWKGVGGQRVALLHYDDSIPLEKSTLTLTSDGGVCIFASPPSYDDPEVILVKNWTKEIPALALLQEGRHAFIGDKRKATKLGPTPTPKCADVT